MLRLNSLRTVWSLRLPLWQLLHDLLELAVKVSRTDTHEVLLVARVIQNKLVQGSGGREGRVELARQQLLQLYAHQNSP